MKVDRRLIINDQEINYTYRKLKRAKRLTITVKRDSSIMVTTPRYYTLGFVEKVIHKQSAWILGKIAEFKKSPSIFFEKQSPGEYDWYKEKARLLILDKIKKLNQAYNFSYKRVSIRRQTTVWGSCSQKGNLNFNYKIYFLPDYLAEYIVVHELCHLQELNHSKSFWGLVAKTIPDYRHRIKILKQSY